MEKKAPERKVLLREEDVFYVYDKRINKCIREDCQGIVKYGLNLKVNMPNGDTLNTYECNKCHMKYTAYPNYVRLTTTEGLSLYNKAEVEARDRKRAEDAAKQKAREKKLAKQYTDKKKKTYHSNENQYGKNTSYSGYKAYGNRDNRGYYSRQDSQGGYQDNQDNRSYHDRRDNQDNRFSRRESEDYRQKAGRHKEYQGGRNKPYERNGYSSGYRKYNQDNNRKSN